MSSAALDGHLARHGPQPVDALAQPGRPRLGFENMEYGTSNMELGMAEGKVRACQHVLSLDLHF
jgi:hypothetical protein